MKRFSLILSILLCLTLVGCVVTPATEPGVPTKPTEPESETVAVETTEPESTEPETTVDTAEPETTEPETTEPTSSAPTEHGQTTAATTAKTTKVTTAATTAKPKKDANAIYAALSADERTCAAYDVNKYMLPLWEGNVSYNESVVALAVKGDDEKVEPISLLYPIDKVLEVRNSKLGKLYVEGTDYEIKDGKLCILPTGNIRIYEYESIYLDEKKGSNSFETFDGSWEYFAEGPVFHYMQLAVSYIHTEEWTGVKPEGKANLLPKTNAKLKNGESLNVVFLGDSITQGANASKAINAQPFCPPWTELTASALANAYPKASVTHSCVAEGGRTSSWGYEQVQNVIAKKPDLVFVEYGVNDGSAHVPAETYVNNMKKIADAIRTALPDCEVVLVSTVCANNKLKDFAFDAAPYVNGLKTLEKQGVAVADVWGIHSELLKYKRFFDMSGNNVNHPNDYLTRMISQIMFQTVTG